MRSPIIEDTFEIRSWWDRLSFLRKARRCGFKVRIAVSSSIAVASGPATIEYIEFVGWVKRSTLFALEMRVERHWRNGVWSTDFGTLIAPHSSVRWVAEENPVIVPVFDGMVDWEREAA